MSRQSFITRGAIPANMNGIELTEQRYAVDRFYHPDDGAAAYLQDNINDWVGGFAGATLVGNTLTISAAVAITADGNFNIVDRTVIIDGAGAALTSGSNATNGNGTHINLVNCQIDIRTAATGAATAFGSWPNAGDGTARVSETFTDIVNPTQAQLATARAGSRSLNLYGCSVNTSDGTGSRFFSPSDMIDCELDWTSDSAANGALFGTTTNGRWVRFAFRKVVDANTAGNGARTNPYGGLRQLGSPVFDGYGIRQGNTGYDTTLIVDEPNFPNARQASFYNMNVVNNDRDQPIQVIGGPSLGSVNDAWGVTNGSGTDPGLISGASNLSLSGVLTTIADKRRFFSDPLFTTGAEGVILRTRTNVVPGAFNAAGDWNLRAQQSAGRTPTANRDVIVDYQTDATGTWSAFRYSIDGGTNYVNGSIDWFFWDTRDNAGSTTLATAWSGNSAPAGTVLLPAQHTYGITTGNNAGSKQLTAYSNETEVRSAVWEVVEASDVYTLPAAGLPLRVNSGNGVVVRDAFFTATDIAAANTPFDASSTKTFQQLFNKTKRDYALWQLGVRPGTTNGNLEWTGDVTISNTDAATELSGNNLVFNRVSQLDNSASTNPINGINITNTLSIQVPFEGRLAASSLNANDQNTRVTDITAPTVDGWSVTATHGVTTINGATTVNLTNASGTHTSESLFGVDEPAGTGDITLTADNPIVVQIVDASSPLNTRFRASTNVTIEQRPADEVTFNVGVQQSASFGATARNFDGYLTVISYDGTNTTVLFGPELITDTNRATTLYTTTSGAIPDGTTIEVRTTGDKWSLGVASFTNADTNGTITAPAIADALWSSTSTSPVTVNSVGIDSSNNLTPQTNTGGTLSESQGNRTAADMRQTANYALAMSRLRRTQDAIRFSPTGFTAPTFDTDIITGSTADNTVLRFQGAGADGSGVLGTRQSVTDNIWQTSQGVAGASPAAIGQVVRQEIEDANVATVPDIEPLY